MEKIGHHYWTEQFGNNSMLMSGTVILWQHINTIKDFNFIKSIDMNVPYRSHILCLFFLITFQFHSVSAQKSSEYDTISQTDVQLYYKKLEDIEKKLRVDSLQRVEIEQMIKASGAVKKSNSQNQQFAKEKAKIESLRSSTTAYPIQGLLHDTLFYVYAKIGESTPQERANNISSRIKTLYKDDFLKIDSIKPYVSDYIFGVVYGETLIMGISEIDAIWAKSTPEELSQAYAEIIKNSIKNTEENYDTDNFYAMRAVAALNGLYGNSAQEATYPTYLMEAPGVPYDASKHNYTLTFKKDELPPVKAFWSFSMYDGITQLFIHNELDRYLLTSNMLEDFVYNDDGSLTFYMQKDAPEAALKANWLPAPDGPFYCTMRLYGPKKEAVNGEWKNPPLLKVQ